MNIQKVLLISPHTDDAELGAGGTIARFIEEGKDIFYIAFSGCEISVPEGLPKDTLRKECIESLKILEVPIEHIQIMDYQVRTLSENRQHILDDLVKIRQRIHPDLILIPSSQDMHQDHKTVYWESLRAFKKESTIWGYEHPWNNLTFTTDIFVQLEQHHVDKKYKALQEYKSQIQRGYMAKRSIESVLYTRGSQIDIEFAEAFELIRQIY